MLVAGFSQFNKDTSFLLRAAATANLGQRRYWFRARPGAGLFVGGSRFVEAVACIGPAVGPSGHAGLVRQVAWSLKYGASLVSGDVAHSALKPASDFRHGAVWSAESKCHHESA
jgi:hypothetical protein